jgi:hypothetical protein
MQGTSDLSKAADYPRSKPAYFPDLTANFGPASTVHVANYSLWCYTEADIEELYYHSKASTRFLESPEESNDLPNWAPWVISAGALSCISPDWFFCRADA